MRRPAPRRATRRPFGLAAGRLRPPTRVAVLLSVLLHLVALMFYAPLADPAGRGGLPDFTIPQRRLDAIRLIDMAETEPEPDPDPAQPETVREPDAAEIEVDPIDLGDEPVAPLERHRTIADRMRAGQGDPRLWAPFERELYMPTLDERLRLELMAAIEAMNDSLAAELLAQVAVTDWTYTDEEGKTWGVSPGRIHMGDVVIPLPFGFGPPPDYDGSRGDMAFRMADIDRAALARAVRESWKDRAKIMRERRIAEEERRRERERARADTLEISA